MSTTPIAKNLQLELSEASSDLRHATAKSMRKPDHRILKSLLEGRSRMDSAYKAVIINLLTSDEEASLGEVRTEAVDQGIEQMQRPWQAKKSGELCRIIGQNDEDGTESDEGIEQRERHLQAMKSGGNCRIIRQNDGDALRKMKAEPDVGIGRMERPSHVKKSGFKCRMEDENDKAGPSKVMKRPSQVMNRKRKCKIIDQRYKDYSSEEETELDEIDSDETESDEIASDEAESDDSESYASESDDVVEIVERPFQVEDRKRKCEVKDQHGGHRGRAQVTKKNKAPLPKSGLQPARSPCDFAARVTPVKSSKGKSHAKGKGVIKHLREADKKKPPVMKDHEKMHNRDSWIRRRKLARGDSRPKAAYAAVKKEEPDHHVETRPPQKGIQRRVRKVKCPKCSRVYCSGEGDWEEGEGSSKSVPEVVILDSDKVLNNEIRSPFVSEKSLHRSMCDDEFDFNEDPNEKKNDNEFKKELLEVLRKPFDRAELKRARETYKSGLYACYHPDVQKRLTKYRYKREYCLTILRGFMFWLKNVSREGVFRPWKHRRYIELELPSD
ncbi:uncharacterized protein LOC121779527 [Salvia splendens]|uniref:uncharacterized protein LOC121779527 n=1 Tax=Salvia splendens TaxID=180675 RepID=UPI001C28089E|nr:uncharacterized protein LOC121779527 [Salvia splendens]XP_042032794.1 uncharacterized protein LOC121779527 [Salvia splendens]